VAEVNDVACETAAVCIGVGYNSAGSGSARVIPIVNGIAGTPVAVPGVFILSGVGCASATTCYAVGLALPPAAPFTSVVVPITNGVPGAVQTVPGSTQLTGVACSSSVECIAVGQLKSPVGNPLGITVPIVSGVATAPVPDALVQNLSKVACGAPTVCVATASTGSLAAGNFHAYTVSIAAGVPAAPVEVPGALAGLADIASTSAATCFAVGDKRTDVAPFDEGALVSVNVGVGTSTQLYTETEALTAIACPGASACVAGGRVGGATPGGQLVPISNGVVDSFVNVGPDLAGIDGIACGSATSCVAVGLGANGGAVLPFGVTGPTPPPPPPVPVPTPLQQFLNAIVALIQYLLHLLHLA
jgi:hypothetical protein